MLLYDRRARCLPNNPEPPEGVDIGAVGPWVEVAGEGEEQQNVVVE
jgi:hypothetical protein